MMGTNILFHALSLISLVVLAFCSSKMVLCRYQGNRRCAQRSRRDVESGLAENEERVCALLGYEASSVLPVCASIHEKNP